jgi:selenocysteine lyase/cysteine desulfurase
VGILVIVDGAHTSGQILLNLKATDPGFHIGDYPKRILSFLRSGFVYTRRVLQTLVEPLGISWGWGENSSAAAGFTYLEYVEWSGTMILPYTSPFRLTFNFKGTQLAGSSAAVTVYVTGRYLENQYN